jgi:hypothetical protein
MKASTPEKDRTMKLSTLVISCALAVGGSAAFAQTDNSGSGSGAQSHGPSLVDKAKSGIHKLGDVTRKVAHKVTGKDSKSGDPTDTSTMGASGSSSGSGSTSDSSAHGKKQQH